MSKIIPLVNTASGGDKFQTLFDRVNQMINLFSNSVVTVSSNNDLTSGNGFVIGVFGANTLSADIIKSATANGTINVDSSARFLSTVTANTLVFGSNTLTVNSSAIAFGNNVIISTNSVYAANAVTAGTYLAVGNALTINSTAINFSNTALNPATVSNRAAVKNQGVTVGTRSFINFIPGSGTAVTTLDNANTNSVDISISLTTNSEVFQGISIVNVATISQTVVDVFNANTYRSGEYFITTIDRNTSNFQINKLLIVHDGASAYHVEHSEVFTSSKLGEFTSNLNAGVISISFTGTSNSTTLKLSKTLFAV